MNMNFLLPLWKQRCVNRPTARGLPKVLLPVAIASFFLVLILYARKDSLTCTKCKDAQPPGCTLQLPSVCLVESCKFDYIRHLQMEDVYPIPAIRHILWRNESVSEYFAVQLRTWQRIHPDWTVVLWRDQDLEPFVTTHFPDLFEKFKSLPENMMRIDMIRYMILYKYGGIYADLDYILVKSLESFRRFHSVITREPEAHALEVRGISWPVKLLANPAFMMSAPGHKFYQYAMLDLKSKETVKDGILNYAGPLGLAEIIEKYQSLMPIARNAMETIYIPPSYSFYPYPNNRLDASNSTHLPTRKKVITKYCNWMWSKSEAHWEHMRKNPHIPTYCKDLNNMDPITDKSQPVFAIHDLTKLGPVYDPRAKDNNYYSIRLIDIRLVVQKVKFGKDFMNWVR